MLETDRRALHQPSFLPVRVRPTDSCRLKVPQTGSLPRSGARPMWAAQGAARLARPDVQLLLERIHVPQLTGSYAAELALHLVRANICGLLIMPYLK